MTLNGVNGQLDIFENKLTIKRKGMMAKMTQGFFAGEKDIFYGQIGSVKVKWGTVLTNGFIQLAPTGGIEHKRGLTKQTQDENTVMFRKSANEHVAKIKDYVEGRIANGAAGQGVGGGAQPSVADELLKFADLRAKGIVSEEQFQAAKAKLLGS
jgi:hypothetical protein